MASSITLNNQSFAVGTLTFGIDSLPNNSAGFTFTIRRDASWDAPGPIWGCVFEQGDGVTWAPIAFINGAGGPAGNDKFGNPNDRTVAQVRWAVNGDGAVDRKTNVRMVFTTERAFTSPQISLVAF